MASKLSDEKIAMYKAMLEKAEPYPDDAPEMNTFDRREADEDRVNASFAKRILEEAGVI